MKLNIFGVNFRIHKRIFLIAIIFSLNIFSSARANSNSDNDKKIFTGILIQFKSNFFAINKKSSKLLIYSPATIGHSELLSTVQFAIKKLKIKKILWAGEIEIADNKILRLNNMAGIHLVEPQLFDKKSNLENDNLKDFLKVTQFDFQDVVVNNFDQNINSKVQHLLPELHYLKLFRHDFYSQYLFPLINILIKMEKLENKDEELCLMRNKFRIQLELNPFKLVDFSALFPLIGEGQVANEINWKEICSFVDKILMDDFDYTDKNNKVTINLIHSKLRKLWQDISKILRSDYNEFKAIGININQKYLDSL